MKPIIFAACDIDYFMSHGFAFIKSSVENRMMVHVVISPKFDEDFNGQVLRLNRFLNIKFYPNFTEEEKKYIIEPKFLDYFYEVKFDTQKTYFSALRFLECGKIIGQNLVPLLILDIDSIINEEIHINDDIDFGLYLRENNITGNNSYEIEGMKVAAGAVYLTPNAKPFIDDVMQYLFNNSLIWFCDQHALYSAYKKNKTKLKFEDLAKENLLDWEFKSGSAVWTGKGQRKFNNKTYIERKKEYDDRLSEELQEH